ncbi:MAG TPA: hypothetical protein VL283_03470 [Candidatus Baltobacteraceae bacterium]|nr:hypothetical protein [Candidatus Baltobacteraceae bacterium]
MNAKERNQWIAIGLVGAAALGFVAWSMQSKPSAPETGGIPEGTVCTMEAKQCPDGSYVGRQGPKCEFAPCPGTAPTQPSAEPEAGLKTSTQLGLTFTYPETLPETYIHTFDWPPKLQMNSGPFTCTEGGDASSRAGMTQQVTIDGHVYCVTEVTEGAAGSIYTQYAYAAERDGKVAIMTFSLRFEQCGNYDEPKKTACETERQNFDIGGTIDAMFSTLR